MKPGLEIPIGKTVADFHKVGVCKICHVPLYSWVSTETQELCGSADCEHPDELCKSEKCARERRRLFRGGKRLKNPCKFPRIRDEASKP